MKRKPWVLPTLAGLLAPLLAACGGSSSSDGDNAPIVVGTTDQITATKAGPAPLDPVQTYEAGQWNVLRAVYQTLMSLPRSGTTPEPDAAKSCGFTDTHSEVYRCVLRDGLHFSNGHRLTATDVKFSIDRMLRIKYRGGPISLLDNIDKVETKGSAQVVFHLKKPDATFPQKIATPAAAIVDHRVYPADGLHKGFSVVGSGPYTLSVRQKDDHASAVTFTRNPTYKGLAKPQNNKVELRMYDSSQDMETALRKGDIDLMNRTLDASQIKGLQNGHVKGIVLDQAQGGDIRILAFNVHASPVSNKAVRQAVAQVVSRSELGSRVYDFQGSPLYSLVPTGITGHTNSFFNKYGNPNVKAARTTLLKAGVTTPVPLKLTYSDPSNSITTREFKELKRQLDASHLFDVTLQNVPNFQTFRDNTSKGRYEAAGSGWSPDFPDADNYLAPFIGKDNSLGTGYSDQRIESTLIPATRQESDRNAAGRDFQEAQDILADDVPILPLWQNQQYVAARDDITGTAWAINSSGSLQIWELGRGVGGK